MAHPGMPVAAAKPGGFDFDDNAVGGCCWGGEIFDLKIASELGEVDGAHHQSLGLAGLDVDVIDRNRKIKGRMQRCWRR